MKTLTIKQPWASLIVERIKNIENRTWKTNYRGRVLIHASASMANNLPKDSCWSHLLTRDQIGFTYNYLQLDDMWADKLLFSSIIGSVEIVDCVKNHNSVWAEKDCWNWVLANPVKFDEPILNVKGKLSFWEYAY